MPAPPPPLTDELVEEILLRVPPEDPACLARAAVVCKRWCRLVADPGFRRRLFRQFRRRRLPMLGFIVRRYPSGTHFLPSSSFRPPDADCRSWRPVDARHGRILFYCDDQHDPAGDITRIKKLIIWTPATGGVRRLPTMSLLADPSWYWSAAVLCGSPGCDHMECPSGGPFNVILVGERDFREFIYAYVFSSEDDEWRMTATIELQLPESLVQRYHYSALVRNSLYFLLTGNMGILEYNLANKELSVIGLPPICNESTVIVHMSVEEDGGRLGFAMVHDFSLRIWLREPAPTPSDGWTWTQHKLVDLKSFLPNSSLSSSPYIVAAADAVGVFVIWDRDGVLAIDLKSNQARNLSNGDDVINIIPYMGFCTPALRVTSINEDPTMGASKNA